MKDKSLVFINPHLAAQYQSGARKSKRMTRNKEKFLEERQAQMERQEAADTAAYERRLAEK